MAGDNLRMQFLALNVDFSCPSPDPLNSKRPGQASVKERYSSKSGYFTDIASSSMGTVADRHRRPAYDNKH